jgi:hypothetical protein
LAILTNILLMLWVKTTKPAHQSVPLVVAWYLRPKSRTGDKVDSIKINSGIELPNGKYVGVDSGVDIR